MSSTASILQGEASTLEGQAAVLSVMQNRAAINFGGFGTTVFDQANANGQFEGRANPTDLSLMMTQKSLNGDIGDTTSGALYFVSPRSGYSYNGFDGATGPATAGILSGGNNIGGNYFSDNWGKPSDSFTNAFNSNSLQTPDGTPLAGGLGGTSVGNDNMSLSVANPNESGSSEASGAIAGGSSDASGASAGGSSEANSGGSSDASGASAGGSSGSGGYGSTTIPQAIDNQSKTMEKDTSAATKAANAISDAVTGAAKTINATAEATEKNLFSRGVMILVGALFLVGGLYMFGRAVGPKIEGKVA